MINLVNLTPHRITVLDRDGKTVLTTIDASGQVARVAVSRRETGLIPITGSIGEIAESGNSIPVFSSTYGEVTGLPPITKGTIYIVSTLVRQACGGRPDVMSPGELVRGADGQPIGCKGLEN